MSHEHLSEIADLRHEAEHAFEAISELGRYPRTLRIDPQRIHEAALKARLDAALLTRIAEQLEQLL